MDFLSNSFLVLYFQILFFLCFLLYFFKKKEYFTLRTILVGLYLFISIVSLLLYKNPFSINFFKPLNFSTSIYFLGLFFLTALPILKLNERKIRNIKPVNKNSIYIFSVIVIFFFLFSILTIVEKFNNLILNLLVDSSYGNEVYLDSRSTVDSKGVNIIGTLTTALRDFPQFLLFYILTFKKPKKIILIGLILSVLASILSGLAVGLRGNVVFILFSSIFCFLIFRKFYSKKIVRRIKIISITSLILLLIPFVILSQGRFDTGYSSYKDSNFASLMYAGQSLLYFNNYAFDNNGIRYGDRVLNLFKRTIWDDVPKTQDLRSLKYNELYISDEVFTTYIGEFVLDFGPFAAFIILSFMSFFLLIKVRFKESTSIYKILILYFIWNSITYGVFLFPYADISGNLRIVILLLLIFYLKLNSLENKKYLL